MSSGSRHQEGAKLRMMQSRLTPAGIPMRTVQQPVIDRHSVSRFEKERYLVRKITHRDMLRVKAFLRLPVRLK